MPPLGGNVSEEVLEFIEEQAEHEGKSPSEMIEFCVGYTARHKYGEEL